MPDRTPAETLTAAAAKLRATATADYVQPGPWIVHQANGFLRVDNDRDTTREAWTVKSGADLAEEARGTAEYIALMHPGVGLALADWLDSAAVGAELIGPDRHALAVARLLLGEAAE
ncbi:hypothetical protein [Kitasatospora sp. NPDC057223]|uniref:hypothetical protein n=1 Tax=Kitasatospora sp. NPDC057223 TaxID=3346055 RepID=UPI00362B8572